MKTIKKIITEEVAEDAASKIEALLEFSEEKNLAEILDKAVVEMLTTADCCIRYLMETELKKHNIAITLEEEKKNDIMDTLKDILNGEKED